MSTNVTVLSQAQVSRQGAVTPDERAAVFAEYEHLVWVALERVADHQY